MVKTTVSSIRQEGAPSHDPYQALRYPEYRWFLLGGTALFMGTQIQTVALGWQVYGLTGDPLSLGFVGLSEALPFLALTLWGGHAADRMDRRTLCVLATLPILGAGLWLLGANLWGAPRSAGLFYAVQALGSELVPREAYANAATWRSALFHSTMVAGPALGGALVVFSPRLAYGVEGALMLFSLATFLFVRQNSSNSR